MKSKSPNRTMESSIVSGWITLTERRGYVPPGYTRKRWERQIVEINLGELEQLAKEYLPDKKDSR